MSSQSDPNLTASAGGGAATKSILKSLRTNPSGKKKKENSSKKAVTFPKDGKISPKLGPVNSFGAIRYFREHSPAIFLRPQNIIKHALYGYFCPLFPRTFTDFGPESNSAVVLLS